jgi:hypothetical protein
VFIRLLGNIRDPHAAVPMEDVRWLDDFIHSQGVSFERAIHVLKRKLFPFNYDPCSWIEGLFYYYGRTKL